MKWSGTEQGDGSSHPAGRGHGLRVSRLGAEERCSWAPPTLRRRAESAVGARGSGSIRLSQNTQETVTSDFKPRAPWILCGRVNVT